MIWLSRERLKSPRIGIGGAVSEGGAAGLVCMTIYHFVIVAPKVFHPTQSFPGPLPREAVESCRASE